jgi:curli biogenesis system outer membrane secretion channel CsgG
MRIVVSLGCSFLLLALTLAPVSSQGADTKVPTISVAKTEASRVAGWQPAMGEGLAEMIITEMANLPNFKVLESVALDDLRAERALGESGEVAQSESVKKGMWKGADYTFKSTVTRFGSKDNSFGGGGIPVPTPFGIGRSHFAVKKSQNEVQIDWRIIDNTTREIVSGATGRAVGIETGTGFDFGSWAGGGFSNNREFMDSALGKATMKALAQIIDKVKTLNVGPGARTLVNQSEAAATVAAIRNIKGVVKLVDGAEIWVSLGAANGFAKGDKVKIYQPIEKKNSKGEVVATSYQPVAEIILSRVQKDKSMGSYGGSTKIQEDYVAVDAAADIDKMD